MTERLGRLLAVAAVWLVMGTTGFSGPAPAASPLSGPTSAGSPPPGAIVSPGPASLTPATPIGPAARPAPSVSPTVLVGGPPPGVRNPLQGVLAVAAIVVAAAAGVFIYRIIRHGL